MWDSLQKSILSPLASDEVTWPYVTQEVLLEYFVALDAASSGVSRDRLSRLLRNGVVPPKAFLPFIARAYELESPIGTKSVVRNIALPKTIVIGCIARLIK